MGGAEIGGRAEMGGAEIGGRAEIGGAEIGGRAEIGGARGEPYESKAEIDGSSLVVLNGG